MQKLTSLITCTLFILFIHSELVFADELQSIEEIRSSDESPCYPIFNFDDEVLEEDCAACREYIEEFARPEDKPILFNELSAKNCQTVNIEFPEKPFSGWSFFTDQDLLTLDSWTDLNDDRNYTMGLGGTLTGAKFSRGILSNVRNWFDGKFKLYTRSSSPPIESIHGLDFGITAFTPGELEERAPIKGDRPYASLVYISSSKFKAYNDDHTIKSKFVIGILGIDIAKAVQRTLHNRAGFSNEDPLGWDNQISEGGELTALYSVERTNLWLKDDIPSTLNWDISYSLQGNIGYYTDAAAGADFRFGRIISPYYAHNANPLSIYNHGNCHRCLGQNNYVFISYRARLVAYNALLQGQVRDSKVTFSGSEIERLLHEAAVGWTFNISKAWQLTYALSYKSKEYKGSEEREHWFGGLYLTHNIQGS